MYILRSCAPQTLRSGHSLSLTGLLLVAHLRAPDRRGCLGVAVVVVQLWVGVVIAALVGRGMRLQPACNLRANTRQSLLQ